MRKKILISFSIISSLVFILFIVFNFMIFPTNYKNYVLIYSKKYNLEPALVYAVIKTESNLTQRQNHHQMQEDLCK